MNRCEVPRAQRCATPQCPYPAEVEMGLLRYCFECSVDVGNRVEKVRAAETARPDLSALAAASAKADRKTLTDRVPRCVKCKRISVFAVCRQCATPEDAERLRMPPLP